ncbi:16500_t:CDS:1, partial [Dentiscutata heterogama]
AYGRAAMITSWVLEKIVVEGSFREIPFGFVQRFILVFKFIKRIVQSLLN